MEEELPPAPLDKLEKLAKVIPGLGIMISFLSGCLYAASGFAIEMIPEVDGATAVIYRSVVSILVFGGVAIFQGDKILAIPSERKYVAVRAISGFFVFVPAYYAFKFMSFSDVNTISTSNPIFVAPLAYFILGEPCGLFHIVLIVSSVFGIVLITRPSVLFGAAEDAVFTAGQQVVGAILSFLSCLGVCGGMISLRKCPKTPATVTTFWFCTATTVISVAMLTAMKYALGLVIVVPTTARQFLWLNVNAACAVANEATFVWSLKLEEANLVALLRTFDIVLAFLFQVAFLDQPVYWTSIVGAVIVVSSVVAICLKKLHQSRPAMFRFLKFQ
ncbi:Solute carrier family 35 member G1 [Halotydeus destructor]|nr:Solute carrier family 35 member G1 [Halotydeus destructor]